MDFSVLEKITGRGPLWPNVLLKGEVYPSDGGLAVVIKTLNLRTGSLIGTMQIETKRMKDAAEAPENFRDALSGEKSQACVKLLKEIRDENLAAVELKARYWAAKVREPDFSYSSLDRLPDIEFADYGTKQKFYELTNYYYEQDRPVILKKDELRQLELLAEKESLARVECQPKRGPEAIAQ